MGVENNFEIRRLNLEDLDAVSVLELLFGQATYPRATEEFLRQDGYHLLVAFDHSPPVGFVSGVEMTHPDKGTEMFLYDLAVAERFRRRGSGRQLVEALMALARRRGCYGMWVLTETENTAAVRTYRSTGGGAGKTCLMFDWRFDN